MKTTQAGNIDPMVSEQFQGEAVDSGELGHIEHRLVQQGMQQHRETTDATQRALKVAEQTAEMASATLVETQRQGLVLDRAEKGLENVEKDVKEASRIVRFMRRWCCFQVICCCDCFDPDVEMDHKRKKSLQERLKDRQDFSEQQLTSRQAQEAAVHRYAATGDPAFDSNKTAARTELLTTAIRRKTNASYEEDVTGLGYGLHQSYRIELREQTRIQDGNLDRIGTTVESLKVMSLELQGELSIQMPQIETLGERAHGAHDQLHDLARQAGKL